MNLLRFSIFLKLSGQLLIVALTLSCSKDDSQFYYGILDVQTPKLVVASNQLGSTALVMYDLQGNFLRVLEDYSSSVLTPRGMAAIDPLNLFVAIDGGTSDIIQRVNVVDGPVQTIADSNINGNIFQMRRHPTHGNFVIETATIESFTDDGRRIGAPRITATVPGCGLTTPRGMAFTQQGNLAVVDTGTDDLVIFNVTNPAATTCVVANTTFGNVDPVAVLAHSDGFLYVATTGDDRIYRFNGNGVGAPVTIFNNIALINNPQALLEMPDGSILVASEGTNNIVRILTDGTYVNGIPFIFDLYTNSISDMILLQETQ